jgi:hypothetical protein
MPKSIYKAEVPYSAIMYVTYELVATGRNISNIFEQEQQMAALHVTGRHVCVANTALNLQS